MYFKIFQSVPINSLERSDLIIKIGKCLYCWQSHKEHLVVTKIGFKNLALMKERHRGREGDKEGEKEGMRMEKEK